MNRPTYENAQSLADEERIIKSFCDGVKIESGQEFIPWKLPRRYKVDYALCSDTKVIRAYAEVKKRDIPSDKYKEIILSFEKYDAMVRLQEYGFKCVLIFEFHDGIFHLDVKSLAECRVGMSGRTDRNDPDDTEPCIWIPNHMWQKCEWSGK